MPSPLEFMEPKKDSRAPLHQLKEDETAVWLRESFMTTVVGEGYIFRK